MYLPSSRTPAALLAAVAFVVLSFAAPLAARADGDAAGGVGVARLNLIQGSVAVQRGDSTTPVDAVINAPVLGGDYVTTGDAARAELQLDGSSMVRLGPGVQLRFTHLDAGNRELQLAEGTIDLRLLRASTGRADIDTPSVSVRPRGAGSYRVSVGADGRTEVTVRSGAADIVTPQGSQELVPGTTLLASGSAASPTLTASSALADDDFDRFNRERDAREQRALADPVRRHRHPGRRRPLPVRPLGDRRLVRPRLGAVPGRVRLGALPRRPLGLGRLLRLDLGRRRALGLGAVPLRELVPQRGLRLGMVPAAARVLRALAARAGRVHLVRRRRLEPGLRQRRHRLVPARTVRAVPPVVGPRLQQQHDRRQRDEQLLRQRNNGTVTHYRNLLTNGVTAVGAKRFTEGRFDHPVALGPAEVKRVAIVRGPVPVVPTEANLRFTQRSAAAPQLAVRPALLEKTFAGNATPVRRTPFEQQRAAIANLTTSATHAKPAAAGTVASPWDRFAAHGATPVDHPLTSPGAAAKERTTTGGNAARGASDPWSRFDNTRGTPGTTSTAPRTHAVTTIDGTTPHTAHATRATTGTAATTDGGSGVRPAPATHTVRTTGAAPHPVQRAEPVREHSTTATARTKTTHHVAQHPQAAHAPG